MSGAKMSMTKQVQDSNRFWSLRNEKLTMILGVDICQGLRNQEIHSQISRLLNCRHAQREV